MDIYRKIAIAIIILLFFYILYRLFKKRAEIMFHKKMEEGFTEALDPITDPNVLAIQKANSLNKNIQNIPQKYYSKPVNSFYIMSAYGGGFDGYNVCDDMMLYTLSLGYRYIAINVFYDVLNNPLLDNQPVNPAPTAIVGFSSLYSPMENIAGYNVALSDLLELIQQNAFSTVSPNPGDPFFLHILPAYKTGTSDSGSDNTSTMSAKGYNDQLNTKIEEALTIIQNTNRASGKIKPSSPISDILGEIVIVMDGASSAGNITTKLQNMIGLNIPSTDLTMAATIKDKCASNTDEEKPAKINKDKWTAVLPFDENGSVLNSIPPYINLYARDKMNVSLVCPWESRFVFTTSVLGPSNLGDYEKMFYNEGSTAFIPI